MGRPFGLVGLGRDGVRALRRAVRTEQLHALCRFFGIIVCPDNGVLIQLLKGDGGAVVAEVVQNAALAPGKLSLFLHRPHVAFRAVGKKQETVRTKLVTVHEGVLVRPGKGGEPIGRKQGVHAQSLVEGRAVLHFTRHALCLPKAFQLRHGHGVFPSDEVGGGVAAVDVGHNSVVLTGLIADRKRKSIARHGKALAVAYDNVQRLFRRHHVKRKKRRHIGGGGGRRRGGRRRRGSGNGERLRFSFDPGLRRRFQAAEKKRRHQDDRAKQQRYDRNQDTSVPACFFLPFCFFHSRSCRIGVSTR